MSWNRIKQNFTLFKRKVFSSLQKVKKSVGGTRTRTRTRTHSSNRSRSGNRSRNIGRSLSNPSIGSLNNHFFDYPMIQRRLDKMPTKYRTVYTKRNKRNKKRK